MGYPRTGTHHKRCGSTSYEDRLQSGLSKHCIVHSRYRSGCRAPAHPGEILCTPRWQDGSPFFWSHTCCPRKKRQRRKFDRRVGAKRRLTELRPWKSVEVSANTTHESCE